MTDGIEQAFALLGPAADPERPAVSVEGIGAPNPEVQRLMTALEAAEAKTATLETRARKTALKGQVSDVDAAMKLLDPEQHLDAEGNVNVAALVQAFPSLSPASLAPTAPDGGGGPQPWGVGLSLDQAVQSGEMPLINMVFEERLKSRN